MRDFILFTAEKITKENCFDKLQAAVKNIKHNGDEVMIDGSNRLYLHFSSERIYEPKDIWSDEFQSVVPIHNACLTYMETYRSIDAKRVVKVLLEDHPELYVYCDDIDWTGSGATFFGN